MNAKTHHEKNREPRNRPGHRERARLGGFADPWEKLELFDSMLITAYLN